MNLIVKGLKDKDPESLRALMDTYGDRLLKSAFLITKDYGSAQDAVQETFIKAYYKIDLFREECSIYTWLYAIMLNQCRKNLLSNWVKRTILKESIDQVSQFSGIEHSAETLDISTAVQNLPHHYRNIAIMFYYEDFSIKDICIATNQKEGTVKSSLSRIRNQLRIALEGGTYNEKSRESNTKKTRAYGK